MPRAADCSSGADGHPAVGRRARRGAQEAILSNHPWARSITLKERAVSAGVHWYDGEHDELHS
jgi:hypothetical protein